MAEAQYISLPDAARELNVTLGTLHYYIRRLSLKSQKFPLDKRAYLEMADFERIKELKDQAARRNLQTDVA